MDWTGGSRQTDNELDRWISKLNRWIHVLDR